MTSVNDFEYPRGIRVFFLSTPLVLSELPLNMISWVQNFLPDQSVRAFQESKNHVLLVSVSLALNTGSGLAKAWGLFGEEVNK